VKLCSYGFVAGSHQLVTYPMGGNWYIINDYVPVIGIIHVMIFARLLEESRFCATSAPVAESGHIPREARRFDAFAAAPNT
jgi:hypothetical protein